MAAKPTYSELLRHPNWQRKRLEVLSRQNFTCQSCGESDQTLHVHHTYYEKGKSPWEYPDESLKVVCEPCHERAQSVLTDLHRQLGRLPVYEVDRVHGYTAGCELELGRSVGKIHVYSEAFAIGLGNVFSINGVMLWRHIINSRQELSIDRLYAIAFSGGEWTDKWINENKEPE